MKKILSLLLAAVILTCTVVTVYAESIEELEERQRQLEEQNADYQAKLDDTNQKVAEQQEYVDALVGKIQNINEQISVSRKKIAALDTDIAAKQKQIDQKNAEIEDSMDALRQRLKAIYMSGDVTSLEIILGAKDFSDFLDKLQIAQYVSNHDEELINKIQAKLDVIAGEKKILEEDKAEQQAEQANLESKQDELNTLLEENKDTLANLQSASEDYQMKLQLSEEELSGLSEEIQEYYRKQREAEEARQRALEEQRQREQNGESGETDDPTYDAPSHVDVPSSGGYVWPTPGFYYLSSTFDEWRGSDNHGALDIAGADIMNSPCYAAAGGTVISTCDTCTHNWGKYYSCGCGGGYGNYVWIDHGNGKESIYGHLSSVTVSPGDTVSAGELIGYVGTTGYSTGPHLHFELHYNGMQYDPMTEY